MKAVPFTEANVVFARNQHEYNPLPAWTDGMLVVSCYKLTLWERVKLLLGRPLWVQQMTFGGALQPQRLTVEYPFRPVTPDEAAAGNPEPDPDRGPDIPETPDPTIDGDFVENDKPAPVAESDGEEPARTLRIVLPDEPTEKTDAGASTS